MLCSHSSIHRGEMAELVWHEEQCSFSSEIQARALYFFPKVGLKNHVAQRHDVGIVWMQQLVIQIIYSDERADDN